MDRLSTRRDTQGDLRFEDREGRVSVAEIPQYAENGGDTVSMTNEIDQGNLFVNSGMGGVKGQYDGRHEAQKEHERRSGKDTFSYRCRALFAACCKPTGFARMPQDEGIIEYSSGIKWRITAFAVAAIVIVLSFSALITASRFASSVEIHPLEHTTSCVTFVDHTQTDRCVGTIAIDMERYLAVTEVRCYPNYGAARSVILHGPVGIIPESNSLPSVVTLLNTDASIGDADGQSSGDHQDPTKLLVGAKEEYGGVYMQRSIVRLSKEHAYEFATNAVYYDARILPQESHGSEVSGRLMSECSPVRWYYSDGSVDLSDGLAAAGASHTRTLHTGLLLEILALLALGIVL